MSFSQLGLGDLKAIGQRLDTLAKSWAAGYQNLASAGKTGIAALTPESLDPVIRSITLEDSDFLLTKDIPTLKAKSNTYQYIVKTAVRSGVDLAGFESFLPQEDASQYLRVAEVLKVYGIRKSITQLAQLINDEGGYAVDLEEENDLNAALSMAEASERDCYVGGDYYMDPSGAVDPLVAAQLNGSLRQVRGIQANIREGDKAQRGIPGDFVAYMNNRSVVFNRKGSVLDRPFLDKVVTAVRDSRGSVKECHCTTSQLAEFRATFFPLERGNIADMYAIRGAGVTNDEKAALPIDSVGGKIDFIPSVFKYNRTFIEPITGSVGVPPVAPAIATASGATATASGFKEGETYRYRVQAVNVSGMSQGSVSSAITIGAGNDNKPVNVTITNVSGAEYYMVFRTPVETSGAAGTEMFIGKTVPTLGGSTVFADNGYLVPGLDGILFLPKDKHRAKLATLGNLLNKMQLGVKGTAFETIYTSYWGVVVDKPRSFALVDNVFQVREGL
jgi:hypothetical protein